MLNSLNLKTLLPYADDLFHAVFGKVLHPEVAKWDQPSENKSHFEKGISIFLLKNFLLTLGIPRGLEVLVCGLRHKYMEENGDILDTAPPLDGFCRDLRSKLKNLYPNYNRTFDPTGIISIIGALCMELENSQVIPLGGDKTTGVTTDKTTKVEDLLETGILVPFSDKSGQQQWCCPAIFYDKEVANAEYPILDGTLEDFERGRHLIGSK